jgi:hypothetical protein
MKPYGRYLQEGNGTWGPNLQMMILSIPALPVGPIIRYSVSNIGVHSHNGSRFQGKVVNINRIRESMGDIFFLLIIQFEIKTLFKPELLFSSIITLFSVYGCHGKECT